MAVISETNSYFKILSIENDLITKSSQITCMVYDTPEDREREKILEPLATIFVNNAREHIYKWEQNIQSIAKDRENFEDIEDEESFMSFLQDNPDIKEKYNKLQDVSHEFNDISQNLLVTEINIDNKKYKDLWLSLGFSIGMCKKINRSLVKIGYTNMTDSVDYDVLYKKLKTRIDNANDC